MPAVDTPQSPTPTHCAFCGAADGAHLPGCAVAGGVADPARAIFDELGSADTERRDPLLGRTVGEYLIEARIGAGGMGIVYRALQPQIGRKVAVKILRPDVASGLEPGGLLAEARAANATRHRGIIDVFGFGELPGVGPYLVMEFLEGEPLSEVIERQAPMLQADTLLILEQVADALGAAHGARLIHRDLKPSNIFLVPEPGGKRFTKLLDFGLAKHRSGQTGETQPSGIVGTPEYMAPEQISGASISARSDLYALGVVAYEMLTRQLPITGANAVELAYNHLKVQPRPPSALVDVTSEMDALVMRLLAKDPKQRPASARIVQAELRRIGKLMQEQMTAVGPGIRSAGRAPRPVVRSRRIWSIAVPSVGIALAATLGASLLLRGTPTPRTALPVSPPPVSAVPPAAPAPPLAVASTPPTRPPEVAVEPPTRPHASPRKVLVAHSTPPVQLPVQPPAPPTNGFLRLLLKKGYADVVIDGAPAGRVPRAEPFELPPGEHALRLEVRGTPLYSTTVRIKSRDTLALPIDVGAQP